MSSLAATRSDNFYNPPNWDPSKISRDKFQNSRGRNQYQRHGLIRFEMPFNFICNGTKANENKEHVIGAGTRYNAKKKKAGMYFSTKIFAFFMKCHECRNSITIRTDPENRAYKIIEGGKIKSEDYTAESVGVHDVVPEKIIKKRENNKIFDLERDIEQKKEVKRFKGNLERILEKNEIMKDDYSVSKLVRKKFYKNKKKNNLINKNSFSGNLLDKKEEDYKISRRISFGSNTDKLKKLQKLLILSKPILEHDAKSKIKERKKLIAATLKIKRNINIKYTNRERCKTVFSYLNK